MCQTPSKYQDNYWQIVYHANALQPSQMSPVVGGCHNHSTAAQKCRSLSWVFLGWPDRTKIPFQAKRICNLVDRTLLYHQRLPRGCHARLAYLRSCKNQNYLLDGLPGKTVNNLKEIKRAGSLEVLFLINLSWTMFMKEFCITHL